MIRRRRGRCPPSPRRSKVPSPFWERASRTSGGCDPSSTSRDHGAAPASFSDVARARAIFRDTSRDVDVVRVAVVARADLRGARHPSARRPRFEPDRRSPPDWSRPASRARPRAPRALADAAARGAPDREDAGADDPAPDPTSDAAELAAIMSHVRAALRVADAPGSPQNRGMVWGEGRNLGMPVRWCLRHDGASFVEEAVGPELSYVSGHSSDAPDVWETDFSGYTQSSQLDDREALLASWVRTNWWAHPDAGDALELTLGRCTDAERADAAVEHDEAVVCARVRDGGVIVARIFVSTREWTPTRMTVRVCGDEERWVFQNWNAHTRSGTAHRTDRADGADGADGASPGLVYPGKTTLTGASGGKQEFRAGGVRANAGASAAFFRTPAPPIGTPGRHPDRVSSTPSRANRGGVTFDSRLPPEVCVERARSSHVLVRPEIDGVDVGPFILDTGASGLVITGRAAETLGLRAFGEVFVSGVAGKVPCRFRRAGSLTLGPVTVDAPVFMEMDVGGIVSGASEPVAGIVGFDAFKSSVLEVGPGGSPVRLYDPATFVAPAAWRWRSLLMVSNVPHVAADFAGAPNGEARVFMIDSGAGGADCIFHARAVEELGLRRLLPPADGGGARSSSRVRGVGGSGGESSGATRAYRGKLEWLRLRETGESGNGSGTESSTGSSTSTSYVDIYVVVDVDVVEIGRGSIRKSERVARGGRGVRPQRTQLRAHLRQRAQLETGGVRRSNRRVALLVDGVDPKPCEGVLCESVEWEEEKATRRAERRKKREAFFPSPEEWRGFLDCVEFGNDQ